MTHRLRNLSWGLIIIALAYGIGVLPFEWNAQLIWVGLATAGAYLVLARRTSQATLQLAQDSSQSTLSLWKSAFTATLINPVLLAVPLFSMTMAAQKLFSVTFNCSTLTSSYCLTSSNGIFQAETVFLAIGILLTFLLLDHGLIVALTLLTNKYIKSSTAASNAAVGLRVLLAGFMVGVVAFMVSGIQMIGSNNFFGGVYTITSRRVIETTSAGFEPLTADGVFLAANVLNHQPYCIRWNPEGGACTDQYDTRPFMMRQIASALQGILLYGVLIAGALRLVSPFSLRLSMTEKTKRGFVDSEADIVLL